MAPNYGSGTPQPHLHLDHKSYAPGELTPQNPVEDCVATLAISALRTIRAHRLCKMHSVASFGGLVFTMQLEISCNCAHTTEKLIESKGGA